MEESTKSIISENITKKRLKRFFSEEKKKYGDSFFITSISDRYHSGLPDYLMVSHGKAQFIEAKSSTGKLTALQLAIADALIKAGARYFVVRPKDKGIVFEEIKKDGSGKGYTTKVFTT